MERDVRFGGGCDTWRELWMSMIALLKRSAKSSAEREEGEEGLRREEMVENSLWGLDSKF